MNDQINKFGLSQLTLGATCDFHTKVNTEIQTATAAALHLEQLAPAYAAAIANLQSVVNRQTAFVSTVSMKETDADRDHLVGVIRSVTNAHDTSPIAAKREAAVLLKAKLAPYAGIGKHEYSKQTAEVKGMIALLKLPENTAAIAALHLDEELEELEKANNAFEQAFTGKIDESAKRQPQSDLDSRALCDQANALYEQITRTVNAYAIVQPTDEIRAFIERMNGVVSVYASIAGGSKPSGEGTPTDPADPSDPGSGDDGTTDAPEEV